jgi:hypothetical protein
MAAGDLTKQSQKETGEKDDESDIFRFSRRLRYFGMYTGLGSG